VGGYVINVLNIKGKYRVSTNYRCCPAGTPSDITDIAVYRNMRYQFSSGTVIGFLDNVPLPSFKIWKLTKSKPIA
jgi:hypothetical protein